MPDIIFALRMHLRITIDLGSRRLQDSRLHPLGETQHINRTMHRRFGGLYGIELIVHGRGRTGQIKNLVDLDIERKGDVVTHQLEQRPAHQMRDVLFTASKKVVQAQHVFALSEQFFAKMRSEKTCAAGDQNFFHPQPFALAWRHCIGTIRVWLRRWSAIVAAKFSLRQNATAQR